VNEASRIAGHTHRADRQAADDRASMDRRAGDGGKPLPSSRRYDGKLSPMKVLIIDDHPVVIQGCQRLLEDMGVDEVLVAATLSEGFRIYRQKHPDVIIVDLSMPSGALGGLSFIRRLRVYDEKTPILVLSMHSDRMIVSRALEVGANGYLLKDTSPEEFAKAFRRVRDGQPYLNHELASQIAFMEARGDRNPLSRMTLRELQTLSLIAEGRPYISIADELHVSYKTVVNTCAQLKAKLGVRTLPELMRIAIQHLPASTNKPSS
jgi:DNA-binding NarL/FixJ family response regulator